jgi:prevent-host-death family protein
VKRVNVAEAKAKLSELIDAALQGDEIVIARRNVPVVRLVAVESAKVKPRCGVLKGLAWIADDFDAPLNELSEYMS